MDSKVLKWLNILLKKFCEPYLLEGIRGDLEELYAIDCQENGSVNAQIKYLFRTLSFFRLSFLKKGLKLKLNLEPMLRNYFNITVRTFNKHKAYVFINVLGLAIGLTAGFIILQYVAYEVGYDQSVPDKENVFRIQTNRYNNGQLTTQWASGAAGAGNLLHQNFPEIEDFAVLKKSDALISVDRRYFSPEYAYYASDKVFDVLGLKLENGIDSLILKEPFSVVLSKEFADRIFPDVDPIGKTLIQNDLEKFVIKGIFEDLPENSHMKLDLLYSFETYIHYQGNDRVKTALNWDGYYNYIKLIEGADVEALEAKLPARVNELYTEAENSASNSAIEFILQPIEDIHLNSNYRGEIKPAGNARTTYFLSIIGLFVLFIAWINYINLTTANSMKRAKEVGIRKVLGSHKKQLIGQFMFESAAINLIALFVASILVVLSMPYFNQYIGRSDPYSMPEQNWFWAGLAVVFLSGIVLSGIYPSLVLSSFKPVTILKGAFSSSSKGSSLRQGLVVFQYLASVVLITGTYVVYQQMSYLKNQELGVEIDQTVVMKGPMVRSDTVFTSKLQVFKNQLLRNADIKQVTTSSSVPGTSPSWNAGGIRMLDQGTDETNQYRVIGCDEKYLDFYGLEITEGRGFDNSFGNERNNVLVSETSLPILGTQNAKDILNKKMFFWGDTFNVVGVVKNFRQESPKSAFDALIFRYSEAWGEYFSAKVKTNDMVKTIAFIEGNWRETYGEQPLDFFFLDDHYDQQYRSEANFGTIFGLFSLLAIIVACLGLFGLASFMTSIRLKEVSVRKVLGASFTSLWSLMTKDFLKLVILSILISLPLSWWLMSNWLDNFEVRINLSFFLFLVPALILIAVSIVTVSYHTIKTALLNPAESLKDE